MRKVFICMILFLIFSSPVFAELVVKGSPDELASHLKEQIAAPGAVTLHGWAAVQAPIEEVVAEIKITSDSSTLESAIQENKKLRASVVRKLLDYGIEKQKITIARFASSYQHRLIKRGERYNVVNFVNITIDNEDQLEKVASISDNNGSIDFKGIAPKEKHNENLRRKACALACDNALEQKKLYEEKIGLILTPVSFSEQVVKVGDGPDHRNRRGKLSAGSNYPIMEKGSFSRGEAGLAAAHLTHAGAFGSTGFEATVSVEYSVEPK